MADTNYRLETDYADVIAECASAAVVDAFHVVRAIESVPMRPGHKVWWADYGTSGAAAEWHSYFAQAKLSAASCREAFQRLVSDQASHVFMGGSFANDSGLNWGAQTSAAGDIDEIEKALTALAGLDKDWDCGGGVAPSPMVIARAVAAVKEMKALHIVGKPSITVSGDGEIGLIWRWGRFVGTLSFLADGMVYGYGFGPGMQKAWKLTSTVYPKGRIGELAGLLATSAG